MMKYINIFPLLTFLEKILTLILFPPAFHRYLHKFFFKLYFIGYAIAVILIIPFCPPSTQAIPPWSFMSMGHAQVLWLLHSLYCTLHPPGYSVTTHLYYLIPSPLHPVPQHPSHLATIKTLSISMILSLFLFAQFVFQIQLLTGMYLLPFYFSQFCSSFS